MATEAQSYSASDKFTTVATRAHLLPELADEKEQARQAHARARYAAMLKLQTVPMVVLRGSVVGAPIEGRPLATEDQAFPITSSTRNGTAFPGDTVLLEPSQARHLAALGQVITPEEAATRAEEAATRGQM